MTTHRHWMSSKTSSDDEDTRKVYTKARNKVKTLMRKAKRNFEKDIAQKSKNIPKAFWSYVRSKLKTKAGVGPLLANVKDKTSTNFTDDKKANILQDQFSSVFTREPEGELPSFSNRTMANIIDIHITEDMMHNDLSLNKSCGPDELHSRLLFELVDELSKPIALLLNNTTRQGVKPRD